MPESEPVDSKTENMADTKLKSRLTHTPYCKADRRDFTISIQGNKGSFHHTAAEYLFGMVNCRERDRFEDVFEDCDSGETEYGLIAIENSIAGSLLYNYDLLANSPTRILAEGFLRISHQLIGFAGTDISELTEIWSHPMALNQSKAYLNSLNARLIETDDTAGAVRELKNSGRGDVAAVASRLAATLYDMEILAEHIETDPRNYTRFLLISKNGSIHPLRHVHQTKSTIHFTLKHKPGALAHFLNMIAFRGINMTKIQSRPRIGEPWVYDFFIDLDWNGQDPQNHPLLEELEDEAQYFKILGTYPCFGYLR